MPDCSTLNCASSVPVSWAGAWLIKSRTTSNDRPYPAHGLRMGRGSPPSRACTRSRSPRARVSTASDWGYGLGRSSASYSKVGRRSTLFGDRFPICGLIICLILESPILPYGLAGDTRISTGTYPLQGRPGHQAELRPVGARLRPTSFDSVCLCDHLWVA